MGWGCTGKGGWWWGAGLGVPMLPAVGTRSALSVALRAARRACPVLGGLWETRGDLILWLPESCPPKMQLFLPVFPVERPLGQRHPPTVGLDPGWALEGPRNALSHPAPNGYDLPVGDTVLPQFAALSARGSCDSCLMPGPAPPWGPHRLLARDAGDLALTPLGDAVFRASVSPSLEGCFRQRDSEPWLFPSSPCSQPQSAQCQRKQLGPPACRERAALPRTGPGLLLLPLRCWTESQLLRHADPLARSLLTKRRRLALGSQLLLATGPTSSTGRWLWATSPVRC